MKAWYIELELKSWCLFFNEERLSKSCFGFDSFSLLRLTLSALGIKLNEYWREVTEKQAKERAFNAVDGNQDEEEKLNDEWVSILFSVISREPPTTPPPRDFSIKRHYEQIAKVFKRYAKIWIKM